MSASKNQSVTPELAAAYAECCTIAKREAKNFYYAFVALPEPRKNAICAIYAFMRKADDLCDDESLSHAERRKNLDAWLAEWHRAAAGEVTEDKVFLAVRHTLAAFSIPLSLLEELVAGTTMDLKDESVQLTADTYPTFEDLYQYCYLVASVVGLVCIRIFGYTGGERAEKLAEETGIAFQLTNILRDVAEDAERKRIYLPLEDLSDHGVSLDALLERRPGTSPDARERKLLAAIAKRAERYYQSAEELIPLIDRESRPAMRVLVEIYHRLLQRIEKADYDVFSERISVPKGEKLRILAGGMARMGMMRLGL